MKATDHLTKITDGRLDRSLTPNADALRIAIADMKAKLGHRLMLSGPDGARARMALACQEAIMLAMAKEIDGGAPEHGVIELMMFCLGDVVAGASLKFSHGAPPEARLHLVDLFCAKLNQQARTACERLDELQAHEISGVMAPRQRPTGRG